MIIFLGPDASSCTGFLLKSSYNANNNKCHQSKPAEQSTIELRTTECTGGSEEGSRKQRSEKTCEKKQHRKEIQYPKEEHD